MNDREARVRAALRYCLDGNLTFAAFRSPAGPIRLWTQRTPEPAFIEGHELDQAGSVFVVAPFLSQMGHVHVIRPEVELVFHSSIDRADLDALDTCTGGRQAEIPVPSGLGKEGYAQAIAAAKEEFAKGGLTKVVLARAVEVPVGHAQLPELFLAAEKDHPEALIALVHTPMHGTWIGASPERLLVIERDHVIIDALAGTMPTEDAPDAANWGAKEREEQDLVTRNILSRIEQLGLRNITATAPHVKNAGQVAHLRTTVTADLGSVNAGMLPFSIHPTPAICGEPVLRSQEFILQYEPQARALYAGFWGPWAVGERSELYVNIRCMQVFADRAVIHVGAGITSGSAPEREWQETELKARTWLDLIDKLPRSRVS